MTLLTETDSTDSDIIAMLYLTAEDKNEVAVVMHLVMKAMVIKIVDQANEMADLLDDTRAVLEEMGDDVTEQYAMGMVSRMIERMGEDDFEDDLNNFRNGGGDGSLVRVRTISYNIVESSIYATTLSHR